MAQSDPGEPQVVHALYCMVGDIQRELGAQRGGRNNELRLESVKRLAATQIEFDTRTADKLCGKGTVFKLIDVVWSSFPALVDPACAFAEPEMEFGITTLFGGFPARFFDAYEEVSPLAADWRERNPLYQLYHLLNHWLIFGGGYAAQALAVLRRYA